MWIKFIFGFLGLWQSQKLRFIDVCCSVAKSSPTLQPHGLQHARLPCLSLSPRVCSNSSPLSWWCYPTISSSVSAFFSCPQSFPASGSFPVYQLFALGNQSIRASASAFHTSNEYSGLNSIRIDWSDLLAVQGTLRSLLQHENLKASFLLHSPFLWSTLTSVHDYW